MELKVECPVCAHSFVALRILSTKPIRPDKEQIACPKCKLEFPLYDNLDKAAREELKKRSDRWKKPKETVSQVIPEQPQKATRSFDRNDLKRHKRNRLIKTLITLTLFAGICGVLIGLLVVQLKKLPLESQQTELNASDESTVTDVTAKQPDEVETVETVELPPQKLDYWNPKQIREIWPEVQPHLVSLKVYDGLGTHEAVGTLVDSRGWVLTSYNAVKGASKIEVTASVSSADELKKQKPLTDLVRGFIDVRKPDDLILLSVNRRFVVSIKPVKIAENIPVVDMQYLFQCAPPSTANLYGITETQVKKRTTFDQLEPAGQALASARKLDNETLDWIVSQGSSRAICGTPMFDVKGDMVAMTSFSSEAATPTNYLLPVATVNEMIKNSKDDVLPLRQLSAGDSTLQIAAATSNEMYENSIRLNQLVEICKAFDWIPKDEKEYLSLQEFGSNFIKIEAFARLKSDSNTLEDRKIISQKEQLENILRDRFSNLSKEDELLFQRANETFAKQSLKQSTQSVPFLGQVDSLDVESARLFIRLLGTNSYVKYEINQSAPLLRVDSKWLFFAETPEKLLVITYQNSSNEFIEADSVSSILSFGSQ